VMWWNRVLRPAMDRSRKEIKESKELEPAQT